MRRAGGVVRTPQGPPAAGDHPLPHSSAVADARLSVLDRIAAAAREAGRSPDDVTLVAVSKQQSDEKIDAIRWQKQRLWNLRREAGFESQKAREDVKREVMDMRLRNKFDVALVEKDIVRIMDKDCFQPKHIEQIRLPPKH